MCIVHAADDFRDRLALGVGACWSRTCSPIRKTEKRTVSSGIDLCYTVKTVREYPCKNMNKLCFIFLLYFYCICGISVYTLIVRFMINIKIINQTVVYRFKDTNDQLWYIMHRRYVNLWRQREHKKEQQYERDVEVLSKKLYRGFSDFFAVSYAPPPRPIISD